jgi:hypothetical protein
MSQIPKPPFPQHIQPQNPSYIVYVSMKCPVSAQLLTKLNKKPVPNTLVQDVHKLKEYPTWLNGTPIVADTGLGLIYKGTDALVLLEKLSNIPEIPKPTPTPKPKPTLPPPTPKTPRSYPLHSRLSEEKVQKKKISRKSNNMDDLFDSEETKNTVPMNLEEMLKARARHVKPTKVEQKEQKEQIVEVIDDVDMDMDMDMDMK